MEANLDGISGMPNTYDYINNVGANPVILIVLVMIIVTYILISSSLGTSTTTVNFTTDGSNVLEIIMWSVFICLILLNGLKYFFDLNITTSVKNLFGKVPEVDITVDSSNEILPDKQVPVPEITTAKQVFNIPDNRYTYMDAKALCKAYGADLANYNQIEDAYKNGAEWCSYGWSDNQMAYFPTQKKTFNKLQKIKGKENDCGRPGINGGFIGNPNARFGVNCYGYKPDITDEERYNMENDPIVPKTKEDIKFERKVDKWRQTLPNIIVSPFNKSQWSEY